MKRRVGRPNKPVVTHDRVIRAALGILDRQGIDAVTMRGIARRLGVDPMAIYNYYDDRNAVLAAAGAFAFDSLEVKPATGWRRRVEALAEAYVDLIARRGALLQHLIAHADTTPAAIRAFDAKFADAVGDMRLRPSAKEAVVDFLHGFAFGVPRTGLDAKFRRLLAAELAVVTDGIRA
jgi:AcrR family transcriptional regulator